MTISQPLENEYQRVLSQAARNKALTSQPKEIPNETFPFAIFNKTFSYSSTRIVEWAVMMMNNDKFRAILAKSDFIIKTFQTNALGLDWEWFRMMQQHWACCPECGCWWPKTDQYWWVRNREKGYLELHACRNCRCTTDRRWGPRKRKRVKRSPA